MKIAKIKVSGTRAYPLIRNRVPAGLIGGYITVEYGAEWDDLNVTAVFQGAVTKDVLNAGTTIQIPPEVVATHDSELRVGFYGTNSEGTIVIPTLWAYLGTVGAAADPSGDESTDPALPVWQQVLNNLGNLSELDTREKQNLVAAINETLAIAGNYELTDADMQDITDRVLNSDEIAQIQKDLADLKYNPISITSISNDVGTVEKGYPVSQMTVNWQVNKTPVSQTVDGVAVDVSARSKVVNMTNKTSVKVTATDERGKTASASTGYNAYNAVYYGTMDDGTEINRDAILALGLQGKRVQNSKGVTFTTNPSENQRIAYALPASYGTPTFRDPSNFPIDMTLATKEPFAFKNAHNHTENYNVWLSTEIITNSKTVVVA